MIRKKYCINFGTRQGISDKIHEKIVQLDKGTKILSADIAKKIPDTVELNITTQVQETDKYKFVTVSESANFPEETLKRIVEEYTHLTTTFHLGYTYHIFYKKIEEGMSDEVNAQFVKGTKILSADIVTTTPDYVKLAITTQAQKTDRYKFVLIPSRANIPEEILKRFFEEHIYLSCSSCFGTICYLFYKIIEE